MLEELRERAKRRLIQEKIAKMLREEILEASDIENGEPVLKVTKKTLKEKLETEIQENNMNDKAMVESLINKFIKSNSHYGKITNIRGNIQPIYNLLKNYAFQKRLDIYALKLKDKILISRTNSNFEDVQKTVEKHSVLIAKTSMIELWDDNQNKILHFLIIPLRKHFPIGYICEENKFEIINNLSI